MQGYSDDLRSRVIRAAADGLSARQAAARFGVGVSTAIVWIRRFRANGEATARRQGKPRGSRLDAHADFILALVEADTKDISLAEIVERLEAERELRVGITSVWKFLDRHGLTYKKDRPRRRAAARGRPSGAAGLVRRPARSRPRQTDLYRRDRRLDQDGAPARPVPARPALQGRRAARALEDHHLHRRASSHGHERTDGARRRDERAGVPRLHRTGARAHARPGRRRDHGHLPAHKPAGVRTAIEAAGASLRYLPPYSPDFNPIEMAFAKLKALLRKTAARTIPDLWKAIKDALPLFAPRECANYFEHAGYEPM